MTKLLNLLARKGLEPISTSGRTLDFRNTSERDRAVKLLTAQGARIATPDRTALTIASSDEDVDEAIDTVVARWRKYAEHSSDAGYRKASKEIFTLFNDRQLALEAIANKTAAHARRHKAPELLKAANELHRAAVKGHPRRAHRALTQINNSPILPLGKTKVTATPKLTYAAQSFLIRNMDNSGPEFHPNFTKDERDRLYRRFKRETGNFSKTAIKDAFLTAWHELKRRAEEDTELPNRRWANRTANPKPRTATEMPKGRKLVVGELIEHYAVSGRSRTPPQDITKNQVGTFVQQHRPEVDPDRLFRDLQTIVKEFLPTRGDQDEES